MEPCTPYQNHHHHSMVVTGSQQGRTCWPYRVKLMSNINTEKCDELLILPLHIHLSTAVSTLCETMHRMHGRDANKVQGKAYIVVY